MVDGFRVEPEQGSEADCLLAGNPFIENSRGEDVERPLADVQRNQGFAMTVRKQTEDVYLDGAQRFVAGFHGCGIPAERRRD